MNKTQISPFALASALPPPHAPPPPGWWVRPPTEAYTTTSPALGRLGTQFRPENRNPPGPPPAPSTTRSEEWPAACLPFGFLTPQAQWEFEKPGSCRQLCVRIFGSSSVSLIQQARPQVVLLGGFGKPTLVRKWLAKMTQMARFGGKWPK